MSVLSNRMMVVATAVLWVAALASAAPGAVGALAGGTDAAPPAVVPRAPVESPEGIPMPEFEIDAGSEPEDAGSVGQGELPL